MSEIHFEPLTNQFRIFGTNYSLQLGLINRKWAVQLLKRKEAINCKIFKDFNEDDFLLSNNIVKWVLSAVPIQFNSRQVVKIVQYLLRQALENKKKRKLRVPMREFKNQKSTILLDSDLGSLQSHNVTYESNSSYSIHKTETEGKIIEKYTCPFCGFRIKSCPNCGIRFIED